MVLRASTPGTAARSRATSGCPLPTTRCLAPGPARAHAVPRPSRTRSPSRASTGFYHQPPQPQEFIGVGTAGRPRPRAQPGPHGGLRAPAHPGHPLRRRRLLQAAIDRPHPVQREPGRASAPTRSSTGAIGSPTAWRSSSATRRPSNRLFGWISYTLSRASRRDTPVQPGADNVPRSSLGPRDVLVPLRLRPDPHPQRPGRLRPAPRLRRVCAGPVRDRQPHHEPFNAGKSTTPTATSTTGSPARPGLPTTTACPLLPDQPALRQAVDLPRWQLETYVDLINAVRGVNPEFTAVQLRLHRLRLRAEGCPSSPTSGIEAKFCL